MWCMHTHLAVFARLVIVSWCWTPFFLSSLSVCLCFLLVFLTSIDLLHFCSIFHAVLCPTIVIDCSISLVDASHASIHLHAHLCLLCSIVADRQWSRYTRIDEDDADVRWRWNFESFDWWWCTWWCVNLVVHLFFVHSIHACMLIALWSLIDRSHSLISTTNMNCRPTPPSIDSSRWALSEGMSGWTSFIHSLCLRRCQWGQSLILVSR